MKEYYVDDIGGRLYLRDEQDIIGMIQTGHYEPEETDIIKKLVHSDAICLDIGANIGYFTVLMAKRCRFVYAFEPEEENSKMLAKNIILNNLENVARFQSAVCEYDGLVDLYLSGLNYGMHRIYPSRWCRAGISHVKGIKIDDISLSKVDFIKMDIEGAEYFALQGMKNTLDIFRPDILMEFHPPTIREAGIDPYDVYRFMTNRDYAIYLAPNIVNPIGFNELVEKTNDEMGGQNIVCIPQKR